MPDVLVEYCIAPYTQRTMNSLAGIDTTKVYHEFSFNRDQVKGLECDQWFIHVDLLNWMEEELNRRADWIAIKILYKKIYHFDFNYVKCLEFYYKNDFDDAMEKFISNAQYKMVWKGEMIYYLHNGIDRNWLNTIDDKLLKHNLRKYLIKSYEMKIDWFIEHRLTIYEFKDDISGHKKIEIDEIFEEISSWGYYIYVTDDFLFLNAIEPPTIMETEVFLPFHGQFLADLNIQDILAVELANKDHRLSFYDHDLDHDIQMQLQARYPMFYKNKELIAYDADEFTNSKIFAYFIYKYRHCLSKVQIPSSFKSHPAVELIRNENKNLKLNVLENTNFRADVISPDNTTVCSLTYVNLPHFLTDHSAETVLSSMKYIHLDMNFNLENLSVLAIQLESLLYTNFSYYNNFEIFILTDYPLAPLSVLIYKLLEHIEKVTTQKIFTVRLTPSNNHVSNSIFNIFLNRPKINYKIEFKNCTFHFQSLLKWFSKVENNISVSFVECRILFGATLDTKIHKMMRNKNVFTFLKVLSFRNMNIDVHLPIICHTIVFDHCHIIPSLWSAISSSTFSTVCFKNMKIELCSIASLKFDRLEFINCEIVSNEMVDFISNCSVDKIRITFKDMNIEISILYKIFCKFNVATFIRCGILCTDNFISEHSIKLKFLSLTEMTINQELINNLIYFDVIQPIEFYNCHHIKNENLLEIWRRNRGQKLIIKGTHEINRYFYFELIALMFENQLDQLHLQFKDAIYFPFENFIELEWKEYSSFLSVNWKKIQIRSVLVNDMTIKLEYLQDGELFDINYDVETCDVQYY